MAEPTPEMAETLAQFAPGVVNYGPEGEPEAVRQARRRLGARAGTTPVHEQTPEEFEADLQYIAEENEMSQLLAEARLLGVEGLRQLLRGATELPWASCVEHDEELLRDVISNLGEQGVTSPDLGLLAGFARALGHAAATAEHGGKVTAKLVLFLLALAVDEQRESRRISDSLFATLSVPDQVEFTIDVDHEAGSFEVWARLDESEACLGDQLGDVFAGFESRVAHALRSALVMCGCEPDLLGCFKVAREALRVARHVTSLTSAS